MDAGRYCLRLETGQTSTLIDPVKRPKGSGGKYVRLLRHSAKPSRSCFLSRYGIWLSGRGRARAEKGGDLAVATIRRIEERQKTRTGGDLTEYRKLLQPLVFTSLL